MKVSIIMAVKNKINELPNTLYSIARQKTSFSYEVCIVDDCSDVELEPTIRKFIPNVKYKKLEEPAGFMFTQGLCLDLISPDTDVVVIQSDDIIYTKDNILEDLCKNVGPRMFSLAEVVDIEIDKNFYKNFEANTEKILKNWDQHKKQRVPNMLGNPGSAIYTGVGWRMWLLFAGAIRREDLNIIDFQKCNCDAVLKVKMHRAGFKCNYLNHVKAIHQRHKKAMYPCPIVKSCSYNCGRKRGGKK